MLKNSDNIPSCTKSLKDNANRHTAISHCSIRQQKLLLAPSSKHAKCFMMTHKRISFYERLLGICLLLMACFALPDPWNRLASLGYFLLALVLIRGLNHPLVEQESGPPPRWLYPSLGLASIGAWVVWSITPAELRSTGIPVIILWSSFAVWSAVRLIRMLALEEQVNPLVLKGALAGYLMLGLAAGLLLSGLETIHPGSFRGVDVALAHVSSNTSVWGINFAQLHYFAFVSLTTMGYGDVVPDSSLAQMLCVAIAVAGTFYVATVMGVLISRLTLQRS